MRKKLLSALLALVMVLSLLPTGAFAAAETQAVDNIISYVSFAYTHPPVMADDWGDKADNDFNALRNVFVVGLKTRVKPQEEDPQRDKFTFAVKGSGDEYTPVNSKYYYSGSAASPLPGSSAVYFEAPKDVLTSGQTKYTVKVTDKNGNYQEKEIQLVKISLKTNSGEELQSDKFIEADAKGLISDGGGVCIFAQQDKLVVYLPTLKTGTDGVGGNGQDFVGWSTTQESNKGGTYIGTSKNDTEKTAYAVFGVKPVQDFVYTGAEPASWGEEFPENSLTFETNIDYGAAETAPVNVYIVNIGNQPLGTKDNDRGFYAMAMSTDHFNISFEIPDAHRDNAGTVKGNANKYWLGAGDNANQGTITPEKAPYIILKCTPKAGLAAGTYTDTLKIDNPLSRITIITLTLTVKPVDVTVDMHEINKEYGQVIKLDENGQWNGSEKPTVSLSGSSSGGTAPAFKDLGLNLDNVGFSGGASVNSDGYTYTNNGKSGSYNVTEVKGTIKVRKATPTGGTSVNATAIKAGQSLKDSALSGVFTNPHNNETVNGTLEWDETDAESPINGDREQKISKNWKFTPTETDKYEEVKGTVSVIVTPKIPTTLHRNTNTPYEETVTYDGNPHRAEVYVTYQNGDQATTLTNAAIKYEYRLHQGEHSGADDAGGDWTAIDANGTNWPKDAGTWDIRATYAGDSDYASASQIFHLTIKPKEVTLIVGNTIKKTYDGTQTVDTFTLNVVGAEYMKGESLKVESFTAAFDDPNAGTGKTVTITEVKLAGNNDKTDPNNYTVPGGVYHTTGTITPASVTIAVNEEAPPSKHYGQLYVFTPENFTAAGLAEGESLSDIGVEFSSAGADVTAGIGNYDITAAVNSGNYTLENSTVGRLEVKTVTLGEDNKDEALQQPPTTTPGYQGSDKSSVQINGGVVVNPYNRDMVVSGTWALTDAAGQFDQAGTVALSWKFTPTDTDHYTGELTGTVDVTVLGKEAVTLTVKDSAVLTVTYDGNEHPLTADMFSVEPASAAITFVYPENTVPKNAGSYTVMVTATPTGADAEQHTEAQMEVVLNIEKAEAEVPELTFSGREGTLLSDLKDLPTTLKGVKIDGGNEEIEGTFHWETSGAAVTAKDGADYTWFFEHGNTNYVNPVKGSARVEMTDDTRTVSAVVYNLPTGDYAVVEVGTGENRLNAGEKVVFYKDAACTDPVSSDTEVPAEAAKFTVPLDDDALTAEAGAIYAKIVGQKTEAKETSYLPELGFTLPFDMVLLHVGGESETVKVTPTDESYKIESDAWTVAGDGANLVDVVDHDNGSATFTAKAAGTTPITVSITFKHPDPDKTETITVTRELPLDITRHYVVLTESVENGTAIAEPTEADKGGTVNVTLTPDSGYHAAGLKVYETDADGRKDTTKPVAVSGSGNSYTFTMPESDVVLVPAFEKGAFAAANEVDNIISYVSFAYTHPPVMADDWGDTTDADFDALRNVFVVGLKERAANPDGSRDSYEVLVKAGDKNSDNAYELVSEYKYSGSAASTQQGSGAVYFEAPEGVLTSGEKTYTVKVTDKNGNYQIQEITLVKISLKANGGEELRKEQFVDADADSLISDGSGLCIFAQQDKSVVFLPALQSGTAGGGSDGDEFVGWGDKSGATAGGTYIETKEQDKTVYAVFGVKPVWDFVYTDDVSSGSFENKNTFGTEVSYGAAAGDDEAIKVYIVNTGNRQLGSKEADGKSFYAMSTSTEHFNISFEIPEEHKDHAGEVGNNSGKYWLGAGENTDKGAIDPDKAPYIILKCTPKTGFSTGTYTDTLKIENPLSRITIISLTLTVNKSTVTVDMGTIEKEYGQTVTLDENGQWNNSAAPTIRVNGKTVDTPTFSELGLALSNEGFGGKAGVNEDTGYAYTVTHQSNTNYNVTIEGNVTVKPTKPDGEESVRATAVRVGESLDRSTLSGAFVNPYNGENVDGELTWDAGQKFDSSSPNEEGVDCRWTFTPSDRNHTTVTGTVKVQVLAKNPTTLHQNVNDNPGTVTYDGEHHRLDFTLTYTDEDGRENPVEGGVISYRYRQHKEHGDESEWQDIADPAVLDNWPKDAGVWDIEASYKGDDQNAPVTEVKHLTIEQKTVELAAEVSGPMEYNGGTDAKSIVAVKVNEASVLFGDRDGVEIADYTAVFDDANAGKEKPVTVTVTQLSGDRAKNYKLPAEGTVHTTAEIAQKPVTITAKDNVSKFYGQLYIFTTESFTVDGLVEGDSFSNVNVEFTSAGAGAGAEFGSYDITATVNGGNYKLTSGSVGTLNVERSGLRLSLAPTATNGYKGGAKSFVQIVGGTVANANNPQMFVDGKWELTDAAGTFGSEGTAVLNWRFTPTDTKNYTGTLEGAVTVTVLDKQPVKLTVKDSAALSVTYDGSEHPLTAEMFGVEPASAEITIVYPENTVPKNAGAYTIIVTATPTGEYAEEYAEAQLAVNLEIKKAAAEAPELTFHGREGTPLSALENLPGTIDGVNGETITGTFQWETSGATVTEKDGADYTWFFEHSDPNYFNPVTGSARVNMDEDPRTVTADVYNLPAGDYAVVNVAASGLKPGEKVVFYKDADCTDPVSGEAEVPSGVETFNVNLDDDALTKEKGTVYAKIVGQKTKTAAIDHLPELGFTLPFDMVLLHVGGENANTSETVTVTPADGTYTINADAWTVAGDGANLVRVEENPENGSATFTALAAGTTTVTVSITFDHPDPAKTGETVTVTKELPLNITRHYVVFIEQVENGAATANPTEADKGGTVTVTLTAASGYHAGGLEVYETGTDGLKDTAKPVTVSGSGNSYTFTMPESDVVLVPAFEKNASTGGGFGGGGLGGGTSMPSIPSEPEDPTLKPEAPADASGEAKAHVTSDEVESAVEEARKNGADEIVIEPQVTGDADKVSVELEKESVDAMADGSDVGLTVKTGAASVTLPGDSLDELADRTGSKVTVSVEEKTDGEVGIEVAIDDKPVETLSGGLKVELPKVSGGNVLVVVGPDGTETIVKKSIVENGHAYAVLDGSCSVKVVENIITFADVASADWYSDAVDFAGSHELFKGVGDNNFAPDTAMTRGMFATVLWRFESGEPVDAKDPFADVAEGSWYTDGVAWASEHGIITGYTSGMFGPQDNVTREQLATMLYRYAVDIGLDVSAGGSLGRFSDSGSVSSYAKEALEWAVGVGLIKGNTDNTINPTGGAKRAEVATIFMRFCELIAK